MKYEIEIVRDGPMRGLQHPKILKARKAIGWRLSQVERQAFALFAITAVKTRATGWRITDEDGEYVSVWSMGWRRTRKRFLRVLRV